MRRIVNSDVDTLDLSKTYPLKIRRDSLKPIGLWYSINLEWIKWCKSEMPDWIHKHNIEIDIDEGKILVISTPKQLAYFIEKYERSVSYSDFLKEVNWEKVTKQYSGIEIRNYEQLKWMRDRDHNTIKSFSAWFSSWDVSSGCIWDLTVVKNYRITKINQKWKNNERKEEEVSSL